MSSILAAASSYRRSFENSYNHIVKWSADNTIRSVECLTLIESDYLICKIGKIFAAALASFIFIPWALVVTCWNRNSPQVDRRPDPLAVEPQEMEPNRRQPARQRDAERGAPPPAPPAERLQPIGRMAPNRRQPARQQDAERAALPPAPPAIGLQPIGRMAPNPRQPARQRDAERVAPPAVQLQPIRQMAPNPMQPVIQRAAAPPPVLRIVNQLNVNNDYVGPNEICELDEAEQQKVIDRFKTLGAQAIQSLSFDQLKEGVPAGTFEQLLERNNTLTNIELKIRFDNRTNKAEIERNFDSKIEVEEREGRNYTFSGDVITSRKELERALNGVKEFAIAELNEKFSEDGWGRNRLFRMNPGEIMGIPGRIQIDCQVTNGPDRLNAFVKTTIGWWGRVHAISGIETPARA